MTRLVLLSLVAGCYNPPEFPPIEDLPIEPMDRCAGARDNELVACVLDGDTLDIGACGDSGERVRLLGINAPEIAHDPEPAECWGPEAEVALREEVEGERVTLTFDVDACEDTYGRALAWVWLSDPSQPDVEPVLLNEWMVRQGFARVYDDFIDGILYEQDLRDAEARAIAEGRGLWGACGG